MAYIPGHIYEIIWVETMNNNPKENKKILNRYERKAEGLRQVHSDLCARYKRYNDSISLITIVISAQITFLALTDIGKILFPFGFTIDLAKANSIFSIVLALFGFIIFICSLLNFIFGLQDKYQRHESGVKLLTVLINNIKDTDDLLETSALNESQIASKIEEISGRYSAICEILYPPIRI